MEETNRQEGQKWLLSGLSVHGKETAGLCCGGNPHRQAWPVRPL
jgi:hypothetical protein